MKTLIVASSPRKDMYSDRIASLIKDETNGLIIHLREKRIGYCSACEYCHEVRKGECIQKDDMFDILQLFKNADRIYLVSPIYWWQVTAQMKTFIDRLYALEKDDWRDKKISVILNAGAEDDDVEFSILKKAFAEMFNYLGVDYSFLGVGTSSEEEWTKKKDKIQSFIKETL